MSIPLNSVGNCWLIQKPRFFNGSGALIYSGLITAVRVPLLLAFIPAIICDSLDAPVEGAGAVVAAGGPAAGAKAAADGSAAAVAGTVPRICWTILFEKSFILGMTSSRFWDWVKKPTSDLFDLMSTNLPSTLMELPILVILPQTT